MPASSPEPLESRESTRERPATRGGALFLCVERSAESLYQEARKKMVEAHVSFETFSAQIDSVRAEAMRLQALAKITGLEIPGALNQAAFEETTGKEGWAKKLDFGSRILQRTLSGAGMYKMLTK